MKNDRFSFLPPLIFPLSDDPNQRMPLAVQRSVRRQNIKFLHNRIHLSPEYFSFMKALVQNNVQHLKKLQSNPPVDSEVRVQHAFPLRLLTAPLFSTSKKWP